MTRQEANKQILKVLEQEIEAFPDGRFQQILWNMGIVDGEMDEKGVMRIKDKHHEESVDTLRKLNIK